VAPLRFVFDTNIVIDWLVFNDDYLRRLRERITLNDITVFRNELALAELTRVLGYEALRLAPTRQIEVRSQYLAQTIDAQMPQGFGSNSLLLPDRFPKCRDRDDDVFLALAFHSRATALITRDKALLKLKKRTPRFDVVVLNVQQMMELVGA
jgi:putative PIN family toxin of toxin-antitoxin system